MDEKYRLKINPKNLKIRIAGFLCKILDINRDIMIYLNLL
jgi:hypothetical protein